MEELRRALTPSRTVTCHHCNTLVEVEKRWCHGCGREMEEKADTLEQRVDEVRARLEEDDKDRDALFTLGAYLAVNDQLQEALDVLNKLTRLHRNIRGCGGLRPGCSI